MEENTGHGACHQACQRRGQQCPGADGRNILAPLRGQRHDAADKCCQRSNTGKSAQGIGHDDRGPGIGHLAGPDAQRQALAGRYFRQNQSLSQKVGCKRARAFKIIGGKQSVRSRNVYRALDAFVC